MPGYLKNLHVIFTHMRAVGFFFNSREDFFSSRRYLYMASYGFLIFNSFSCVKDFYDFLAFSHLKNFLTTHLFLSSLKHDVIYKNLQRQVIRQLNSVHATERGENAIFIALIYRLTEASKLRNSPQTN